MKTMKSCLFEENLVGQVIDQMMFGYESTLKVLDVFSCECNLPPGAIDNLPHGVLPIENFPGLLILVNIDGDLINKLLINMFILVYKCKHPINFRVKCLILIKITKMLSSKFFFLSNNDIELVLLRTNSTFDL
jgi:hypothetical protein